MSFIIHFICLFILILVAFALSGLFEVIAENYTDKGWIIKLSGIAGWVIPFALISSF